MAQFGYRATPLDARPQKAGLLGPWRNVAISSPILARLRSRILVGPGLISLALVALLLSGSIFLYRSSSSGGAFLREYWPVAQTAALRHNTLAGVSNEAFAAWMMRILLIEMGGETWIDNPLLTRIWLPLWLRLQALENDLLRSNTSVGLSQIRPETVQQLRQGWIVHGGRVIFHGVKPAYPVEGDGPYRTSSQRLLDPAVAIEYLAANLEMGTQVARAWGYEPTLEDLTRWHNTGVGRWTPQRDLAWQQLWSKGERYVDRVVRLRSPLNELPESPSRAVVSRLPRLSRGDEE